MYCSKGRSVTDHFSVPDSQWYFKLCSCSTTAKLNNTELLVATKVVFCCATNTTFEQHVGSSKSNLIIVLYIFKKTVVNCGGIIHLSDCTTAVSSCKVKLGLHQPTVKAQASESAQLSEYNLWVLILPLLSSHLTIMTIISYYCFLFF